MSHDGRPGTRPIIFIDWDFFNELVTRAKEGGFPQMSRVASRVLIG